MLPKQPELREKLLKLVQESVQFTREIETLREDIKNNAEIAIEEYPVTKKEYNALVKAALDKAKLEDQIEELSTTVSHYEILIGEREAPEEEEQSEE